MHKLLFIDTETGGLDPSKNSILSLGAVVWEDSHIFDGFEVLILEPDLVIDEEAVEINRIDVNSIHAYGQKPTEAIKKFHQFLRKHFEDGMNKERIPIAGHNVSFDIAFLKRLYRLTGVDFDRWFSHRVLDTASVIRFLMVAGKLPLVHGSSSEAFEYFDIKFNRDERHTALADARATALLLNKLLALAK